MINLTDRARIKAQELHKKNPAYKNRGLRIYVVQSEVDEMEYGVAFDSAKPDDVSVHIEGGLNLLIAPHCRNLLRDGVIDYVEHPDGSGFVVYNPNESGRFSRRPSIRQQ